MTDYCIPLDSKSIFAAVELAKYWEHREKNPQKARDLIEPLYGLPLSDRHRRELEHRRKRLEVKIIRISEGKNNSVIHESSGQVAFRPSRADSNTAR